MSDSIVEFKIGGEWKLPSISGYKPSFSKGFVTTEMDGGLPRIRGNYRYQPIPVSATYEFFSEGQIQTFFQFYYGAIASGAKRFKAKLDISGELVEYVCQLTKEPVTSEWAGYYASITLEMLVVPDYDPNWLSTLYAITSAYNSTTDFINMMELLPEALDPMGYTPYIP